MSENAFQIGDEIKFAGGRGEIIDKENRRGQKMVKILTSTGDLRRFPTKLPYLTIENH